jgi:hypothetical protein
MNIPLVMPAAEWKEKWGYWTVHPLHDLEEWTDEVRNGDTRQGYWEWAIAREEEDATI